MPKRRRRRGEGSVFYDRYGKTWVARVSLGMRDGKPVGKKVRAPSEAAAKSELELLQRLYGAGGVPALMPLHEYLSEWLRDIETTVRPSTFISYSGHVRMHISPLLGGIRTCDLRPSDVRRLIGDRQRAGLAPATIRRIVTTLQMALGRGVRESSIPTNAANGLKLPRTERHQIRAMTFKDADAIVAAVRGDIHEALYITLLYSGMRSGEASALDWEDVDLDTGTITVRRGKTAASARIVPLATIALLAMKAHRLRTPGGPHDPVFIGVRGGRLRVDVATHNFPRLLVAAGLPRMRVHDLRHGTATLLLSLGVPARDIADLLGHSTPSITMNVYMHVSEQMRRESVQMLNRPRKVDSGGA